MHIFPALIGEFRSDVTDGKEVLRDWDFPFIHRTVDSDSGCLEASVRMVYCAAFYCNANRGNSKVTRSWFTLFKKSKRQADEAQPALLASKNFFRLRPGPE